jgi:D-aminopeptidase
VPSLPVRLKLEQNRSEEVDAVCLLPGWERVDAYTVECECATWAEAHVMARRAMATALTGASNNR